MTSILTFIQDSIAELRQVRWPTRQQAIRLSIVVIVFTLICTALLGVLDIGLAELLQRILTFTA